MSLQDGSYIITATNGDRVVGRNFIEDKSLLPKHLVSLGHGHSPPTYEIHAVGDGKYKIKTGGVYVGVLPNGHVMAFLLEDMLQGAEWTIKHVPQHGEHAYIIVKGHDESHGWTSQDHEFAQISVGPIVCMFSEPPMYPASVVFNIRRVD